MDDPNAQNDPTARIPVPPPPEASATPPPPDAPETPPPAPPVTPPPAAPAPPATGWVTPAPKAKRDDGTPIASIIVGLVLVGIGLWFFAEYTLGLDMPNLRWSQLWPVILIIVGAVVLLGARRDRR